MTSKNSFYSLLSFNKLWAILLIASSLCACSNSKEVTFKSSGVTQTFTQGKTGIPKDFENFIYPGATTAGSVSAEGENEEQSKFLMLSCKDSIDTVSKWYQDKLKSEDWKTINSQDQSKLISITAHKDNAEFNAMITEDNNTTSISLSLAKQTDGNYGDDNNHENDSPNKITPPTD